MPKRKERYGEGFNEIKLVDDFRSSMEWAKDGLIVLTGNYTLTSELDRYREYGYPIFAPTTASAKLEIDRMHGMKVAESVGIAIPEYHVFGGLQETEAFVRKNGGEWVFKPGGDADDKSLTYVSSDPADMVGWLRRQIAAGKSMKQCMLQKKVEILSELGVSGWMGPEGFLPDCYGMSVEHKKLMNGEIGPATGESGTVMWYSEDDKLCSEMLLPFEPILRTLGHRGDFSVGAIIDTKGKAWFLEVTARMGYPAWWGQMAVHKDDPAQWMKDLLDGKDSLRASYDVSIPVVMAQPPYPYQHDVPRDMVEGNPISGVDKVADQVHLCSVMRGRGPYMEGDAIKEGPILQTTGPYVLCVTGVGKTIEAARKKVYAAAKEVKFANRMYRTDIGEKIADCLDGLHGFGYALDLEA